MAAISLRALRKQHAARRGEPLAAPALAALDLEVADGELLVLVGPSGCGKSTALRLIAGLEEPTSGGVWLDDRDLSGVPPQERDVAMVFHGYALYPHMTVRENIAFPLKMRSQPRAARAQRVEEIAALVGLQDKLARLPGELSGGERQRVAMGRAIVRQPKVFLFDEPLSNLDAKLRAELRVELVQLIKRLGTTAVYVTHDQAEAMTMGDRVAVLNRGELQQVAPPRELYQQPANAFVATFVGTPAMNLLQVYGEGRQRRITDQPNGPSVEVPAEFAERAGLQCGFRPEDVVLHAESGADDDAALQLSLPVKAVEPLGAETYVYLEAEGLELRARVAGFAEQQVDSMAHIAVRGDRLHWFGSGGEQLSDD